VPTVAMKDGRHSPEVLLIKQIFLQYFFTQLWQGDFPGEAKEFNGDLAFERTGDSYDGWHFDVGFEVASAKYQFLHYKL